jgi:hypothetical protein
MQIVHHVGNCLVYAATLRWSDLTTNYMAVSHLPSRPPLKASSNITKDTK